MNIISRNIPFFNLKLKSTKEKYFDKPVKIIEFIVLLTFYILMAVFLASTFTPEGYKQIIGQFQVFTAIYLAYRFRYLGLTIGLLFNSIETLFILYSCIVNPNFSIFAGLTSKVLTIVFSIVMAILSNIQETQKEKLQEQKLKLELLSVTDDLTGVYNHRFFNTTLDDEIEKANSSKSCLGFIIIDIDNFKMCNDVNGHDYGDNILKGTASIIKEAVGDKNHICRYGGDEFAVILPG
ncbi:MAG: GGDEF domain-containing protein, partial [Clostridiaceae bacterium]|nr:GGDEF domain-containing protein [Clostridiaceae bacterium]